MRDKLTSMYRALGVASAAATLIGCASRNATPNSMQAATLKPETYRPDTDAGVGVSTVGPPNDLRSLVVANSGRFHRKEQPFALNGIERGFDMTQLAERLTQQSGGMALLYDAPPETDDSVDLEPQPHRRLAGVLVGDSVLAIIDMGDGQAPRIIRPGEQVPNTEWTVVSIDQDKAVLRRKGPRKPTQVTVYLESGTDISNLQLGGPQGGPGTPGGPQPGGSPTGAAPGPGK